VVFATVRRARAFDRRLVLSGYRPSALIAAKTCGALGPGRRHRRLRRDHHAVLLAPAGFVGHSVTFMLAAATYAALGLLIGVLSGRPGRLFLIIMISMLDTFLENPVDNPLANKPMLEFFPSYGRPVRGPREPSTTSYWPAWPPYRWPGRPSSPCSAWPCCACACPGPPARQHHHAWQHHRPARRRLAHHQLTRTIRR